MVHMAESKAAAPNCGRKAGKTRVKTRTLLQPNCDIIGHITIPGPLTNIRA